MTATTNVYNYAKNRPDFRRVAVLEIGKQREFRVAED